LDPPRIQLEGRPSGALPRRWAAWGSVHAALEVARGGSGDVSAFPRYTRAFVGRGWDRGICPSVSRDDEVASRRGGSTGLGLVSDRPRSTAVACFFAALLVAARSPTPRSAPQPTRLVTRTEESDSYASPKDSKTRGQSESEGVARRFLGEISLSEGAHHRPLQTPPRWLEGARAYGPGPERW